MSKRKNKGLMLFASVLALGLVGGVVSCKPNTDQPVNPQPVDPVEEKLGVTSVSIENKADFAEALAQGTTVKLALKFDKEINLVEALQKGLVKLESSDTKVVFVSGQMVKCVGVGEATVTVKADDATDSVKVSVFRIPADGEEVDLADVISLPMNTDRVFKTKGVVTGLQSGVYGNFNLMVPVETADGYWDTTAEWIQVYGSTGLAGSETNWSYTDSKGVVQNEDHAKSVLTKGKDGTYTFTNPRDWQTNENTKDIVNGDLVELEVLRADYNGTKEVNGVNVRKVGHKEFPPMPEPEVTEFTSLSEVLAGDAGTVNGLKKFHGTVRIESCKGDKYGNMEVTDLDGSNKVTVFGSTATESAFTWDGVGEKYTFVNPKDFSTNDLTKDLVKGQTIEVDAIRADYKDTLQLNLIVKSKTPYTVEGITLSGESSIEEGSTTTLSAAIATTPAGVEPNLTWVSSDEAVATVSGGVVTALTAGTTDITASIGDIVSNTFTLTVTARTAPIELPAIYNFGTWTEGRGSISTTAITEIPVANIPHTGGDLVLSITGTKMFNGAKEANALGIKFGSSSAAGDITFTLGAATATKMVVTGIGWVASDKICVGDQEFTTTGAYGTANNDPANVGSYTFDITGMSSVKIDLKNRFFITTVSFLAE